MSKKTSKLSIKKTDIFLLHIRDSIVRIQKFIEGKTFSDFCLDPKLEDAIYWNLTKIGEAAGKLTTGISHPNNIPWQEIKALRNKLIHEYWSIDQREVWQIVTVDIPQLRLNLEPYVQQLEDQSPEILDKELDGEII